MPTVAELAPSPASTPPTCAHCGQPALATGAREQDRLYFCCAGCETVFDILHQGGLGQYYRLPQKRSQAVRAPSRTFDEFDHPAFASAHQQDRDDGISCATLQLRGLECASCVWLIERLPRLVPGVQRAEVDLSRSAVILEWDRTATPLSGIARMLTSIGYEPYPFLGLNAEKARRQEDRDGLVRIGVAGALAANVMLISLGTYSGWVTDGVRTEHRKCIALQTTPPANCLQS
jgi:hypothetical protein